MLLSFFQFRNVLLDRIARLPTDVNEKEMLTKIAKRRASWLYTNRLRVPSDGEVKLATDTIGWRCEGDGGYMNVGEHVMMMMMMIVQVMMVVLGVMPDRGMFGYVKAKKRLQSATRSTNGNVVADGGSG